MLEPRHDRRSRDGGLSGPAGSALGGRGPTSAAATGSATPGALPASRVDRRDEHGPFDIIGDVHGCFDELVALLDPLGYAVTADRSAEERYRVAPPAGRRAVFLGDLVNRGPRTPDVLRLVMTMASTGAAWCLPGNHDVKLARALSGRHVRVSHGLAASLEQLAAETEAFRGLLVAFFGALPSHLVLDDGRLVVAHGGMTAELQGQDSKRARAFALYGDTTGETDSLGLPVRADWAAAYRGFARVVYGHTPTSEPRWVNGTVNIDTGCVFGGRLTALRYPELDLVSVPAARVHYEPARQLP